MGFILVPAIFAAAYYLIVTTKKGTIVRMKKFKASRPLEQIQLEHAKRLSEQDNLEEVDLVNRVNRSSGLDYFFFKENEIDD